MVAKLEDKILFFDSELDNEEKAKKLNSEGRLRNCDALIHQAFIGKSNAGLYGLHIEVLCSDSLGFYTSWGTYTSLERHDQCMSTFSVVRAEELKGKKVTAYLACNLLVGLAARK